MTNSNNLNIKMLYTSYFDHSSKDKTKIEDVFVSDEVAKKVLNPFFEKNASSILAHIQDPDIIGSTLEINFYVQNTSKTVALLPFILNDNGELVGHLNFAPEINDLFIISYKDAGIFTENDIRKFVTILEDNKSKLNLTLKRR